MTTEREPAFITQIGEGHAGIGADAIHVNTVLGRRGSPFETAWVGALASPRPGHVPFLVTLRPGVVVQPPSLFVNKATLAGEEHERLTWGAAQAGVAEAIADAVSAGVVAGDGGPRVGELLLLVAVWVDPAAGDEGAVRANARSATASALESGRRGGPDPAEIMSARSSVTNAYLTSQAAATNIVR
jgi:5,6,7,8-tetrahydromethanopterin hydro-lyase